MLRSRVCRPVYSIIVYSITRRKPEITLASVYIHYSSLNLMLTLEGIQNFSTFYSVLPDLRKNINSWNVRVHRLRPFLLLRETYRWRRAWGIGEVIRTWESRSIRREAFHVATLFTINLMRTELERIQDSTVTGRRPTA